MKKEIWIEKLIELLNEYAKVLWIWDYVWWHNKKTVENSDYIFTKKFWFIKWLVENEKIDIKKLVVKWEMRSWWDFDHKKWNEEVGEEIWNKYYSELCLMLLSIQDEPIRFLCEILK